MHGKAKLNMGYTWSLAVFPPQQTELQQKEPEILRRKN